MIVGHLGRLLESLASPVSVEKLVIQMSDDLKSLSQLKLVLGKIGQEMLTNLKKNIRASQSRYSTEIKPFSFSDSLLRLKLYI